MPPHPSPIQPRPTLSAPMSPHRFRLSATECRRQLTTDVTSWRAYLLARLTLPTVTSHRTSCHRLSLPATPPIRTVHPPVRFASIRPRFLPLVRRAFRLFLRDRTRCDLVARALSQSRTRSWHHLCHLNQLFQLIILVQFLGLILALAAHIPAPALPF